MSTRGTENPIVSDQSASLESQLENDLAIAACTRVPVLITAPPDCAFAIARVIADRSGATGSAALQILDTAAGDAFLMALTDESLRAAAAAGTTTLMLPEVQNLSRIEQKRLRDVLDRRRSWSDAATPRLITTSSVSLFERVQQRTFDARLFNRLNLIHIVVPPHAR